MLYSDPTNSPTSCPAPLLVAVVLLHWRVPSPSPSCSCPCSSSCSYRHEEIAVDLGQWLQNMVQWLQNMVQRLRVEGGVAHRGRTPLLVQELLLLLLLEHIVLTSHATATAAAADNSLRCTNGNRM